MRIIELEEIKTLLPGVSLIPVIEKGFVAYSIGHAVVPPVGELILEKGEVHIKYGYIRSQSYYVIKIASGFYENPKLGLSSSNGCMLLFCQDTGQIKAVLLDEGHLTDVRTAVAGAIAAKHLAPKSIGRIGILGTGIQARLQLKYLQSVTNCRDVLVWGRSREKLDRYVGDISKANVELPFRISTTDNTDEVQDSCDLIVTTTPSKSPLLNAGKLRTGTHITAVGSDVPEKQELDTAILVAANRVIADSIAQCQDRGEISHALRNGSIRNKDLVELGNVIAGTAQGRTSEHDITIADLTGVAVQDIQIATAIFDQLDSSDNCDSHNK